MASNQEALETLRWKKFPVLNDGFVCLVDVMGSDDSIVQAARVSYGEGTKSVSDDRTLIRYLMRHKHTTPFEMAEIKLLIRIPMDAWRQWVRHRTASINEYSTRYSVAIDSAQTTEPNAWRAQATANRQGSADYFDPAVGAELSEEERQFQEDARALYTKRVEMGVAREQARKDLPLSTYTQAYWKCDLHNLFHFLSLRMEGHAQLEIREYATVIGEQIVKPLFPCAYDAFVDYRLQSETLSRLEQETIARLAAAHKIPASLEDFMACGDPSWQGLTRCRERDEALAKLVKMGLVKE
ncbi:MAG: FAD-dependent thymidylate synthase [Thermoguttaceae bacterium]|jgi:thymidylate synthase (FAD)|nr:FAD-dependent thymidylate synthase [Thermoguttaceae bacterium]